MGLCGSSGPNMNPEKVDLTHFDVHRVVGEGGFGKVKAVIKKSPEGGDKDVMYAMKQMDKRVALKRRMTKEFFNERNILAMLSSAFLCNAHYCFQDNKYCYIVMDLCMGGDLKVRRAKICMPVLFLWLGKDNDAIG